MIFRIWLCSYTLIFKSASRFIQKNHCVFKKHLPVPQAFEALLATWPFGVNMLKKVIRLRFAYTGLYLRHAKVKHG